MNQLFRRDSISRPALLLIAGRSAGFVASFAIPVILARRFDRAAFGTYKQLFLIYTTLYGLAQFGAAESLYYFVPRSGAEAGRRVCNAVITLALMGATCCAVLVGARTSVARWLVNPDIVHDLPIIGVFLAFTLVTAVFEIVMVSRNEHLKAACTYAGSDVARTILFTLPALAFGSLRAVLIGAVAFAALRVAALVIYLSREFGRELRVSLRLWRDQFAYALPFALAVGIDVIQSNFHQWAVASRFDAATFAIYAVGCLQIPLVDLVCSSTGNVMMVRMAEAANEGKSSALRLWHEAIIRLASLIFPLAAFLLLAAHGVIVFLFTSRYAASVPIFMVWCLMMLPSVFAVDGVLRAHAQTRFLLVMNTARLAAIAGLITWFMSTFGLTGAVLVTLVVTSVAKATGVVKIASVMNVGIGEVLPWKRLAATAGHAALAAVPAWWVQRTLTAPLLLTLVVSAAAYGTALAVIWLIRVSWRQPVGRAAVTRLPSGCPTEET